MKTIRWLTLMCFVIAGLLALQNLAVAQEINKEETKGPWILHSLAPGDSIVRYSPYCTYWLQLLLYVRPYDSTFSCWNDYHCYRWVDNGDGVLSTCDTVYMEWQTVGGVPRPDTTCYKMHVSNVTLTLKLKRQTPPKDSMYLEYVGGLVFPPPPPVGTTWHEVWPLYSPTFQIDAAFKDSLHTTTADTLRTCIYVHFQGDDWWHVEDVSTDITLDSHIETYCPEIPTLTQWGLIILVILLISSGVFIGLKRRKRTVPA